MIFIMSLPILFGKSKKSSSQCARRKLYKNLTGKTVFPVRFLYNLYVLPVAARFFRPSK